MHDALMNYLRIFKRTFKIYRDNLSSMYIHMYVGVYLHWYNIIANTLSQK